MTKNFLAITAALLVALSGSLLTVSAAVPETETNSTKTTADFIKSLTPEQKQQINSKYKTGYIKPKITIPKIQTNQKIYKSSNIPSAYDLRTKNKVTSVKDQGSTSGSCWAFASIGSLESCLMPTENRDFSENNLKNNSGFDLDPNAGGNDIMATAYFARWSGPYNEIDDPYNGSSTSSTSTGSVQKHVQDAVYLPPRANSTDNDAIKSAIMQYGAVSTSMYMGGYDETVINSGYTNAYYSSNSNNVNHGIDIVGWDDSYSRNNFCDYDDVNAVPAGDGAFIAKNSWGTSWGDGGYFYISYYDLNLAYIMSSVYYDAESTSNYSDIYQYDPLGWVGHYNYSWMANVFTANDGNPLAAVSFYAVNPSTSYSVYVVSNYSGASSLDNMGTPVKSGSLTYSGYYTVNLNDAIPLTAGKKFAVLVKFSSPNGGAVPAEFADSGYSSKAAASPGQSYISSDGNSWQDTTQSDSTCNVCLKAFSEKQAAVTSIAVKSNPTKTSYMEGQSLDLSGAYITVNYSDGTSAEVSITSDMVSGFDSSTPGAQNVTVTYGGKTASFTVNVVENSVTSIAMKSNPSALTYVSGQSLNLNGAAITVDYTDGTSRDIDVTNTMVSGYNSDDVGLQTITVTYGGKTATFTINVLPSASVTYEGHIQNIGWQQGWVPNGAECGTDGQCLRIEAINVKLSNATNLGIEYQVHVQNKGWMDWTPGGTVAGTEGQCLRIEAVRIQLTGANAKYYSVAYKAHVQNIGWQNWVKDGEEAGTTGQCLRVEALKIIIVPKLASVSYSAHVENIGWQGAVSNGALSGTTGKALRIEAMQINLENAPAGLSIQYNAHVQNIGWQGFVSDGNTAGTTGERLRIEALEIKLYTDPNKLIGTDKYKYKVIYQVHVEDIGWMDWQSNGSMAGTAGRCLQVEAVRIMIVPDV